MRHIKFGNYWPKSSWYKDVNARQTMDEERCTTDDDGRQPLAIGHLSYPGDLKNIFLKNVVFVSNTIALETGYIIWQLGKL